MRRDGAPERARRRPRDTRTTCARVDLRDREEERHVRDEDDAREREQDLEAETGTDARVGRARTLARRALLGLRLGTRRRHALRLSRRRRSPDRPARPRRTRARTCRRRRTRAIASSPSRAGSPPPCSCTGRRGRRTRAARGPCASCRPGVPSGFFASRSRVGERRGVVGRVLDAEDDAHRADHELARAERADEADVDPPVEARRARHRLERAADASRRRCARSPGSARAPRHRHREQHPEHGRDDDDDRADVAQEAARGLAAPCAATTRGCGTRYDGISSTSGRPLPLRRRSPQDPARRRAPSKMPAK